MLNIDTLDTVIALVVVILLLSLIVQAVQGFIKKILKLKSKQIEESLIDLFDSVLRGQKVPAVATWRTYLSAWLPRIFPPSGLATASTEAKSLLAAVKQEMQELGRVTARGRFMMDSLSKSDLLNVLARVAPNTIIGTFTTNLQNAMNGIQAIDAALKGVTAANLPGQTNALFVKVQAALAPLQQHYNALTTGGAVKPGVVVADVLALRDVVFGDTLDLIAGIQKTVAEEIAKGSTPALVGVQQSLTAVTNAINTARTALDTTFGEFRSKLTETEQWFDTVMQGFEERYHRGMRTWSIIIAAFVVLFLDANVFKLYKQIATSETLRSGLVAAGPRIAQLQQEIAAAEAKEETAAAAATTSAPPKPEELEAKRAELQKLVGTYTTFGFTPMTWRRVGDFWGDLLRSGTHPTNGDWVDRRVRNLRTLLGWFVMTLLLSMGAPFWHDALESLFGIKNLLRRRNEQQNVEQRRGAGNPKP